MPKRIALLGIYHETNTFIDTPTTLDDFRNGYWLEGEAIRREYAGAHHEISGVIEAIEACPDLLLVPVLYVSATPGGLIAQQTCEALLAALWRALDAVLPVDGCVVVPHGAGVAEGYPDLDGHWLGVLRGKLGPAVPITGTLDPHANLSPAMVAATDALVAYATNPHVDQRATGRRATELLIKRLRGEIRPVQHLVQLPLAISIEQQHTGHEPCRSLYGEVEELRRRHGLLSASVLLGFPYADVPDMGSAVLLIGDETQFSQRHFSRLGQELADFVLRRKEEFNGEKTPIDRMLPTLSSLPGPVLLLDMGDNVGGGAPGNSTHLLEALEGAGVAPAFVCLHDPAAVREAARHQPGEQFRLVVGDALAPYPADVRLLQHVDGRFTEPTPKHGGYVHYDMGETVLVQTALGNTLMITTHRTPPYSLRQLTTFGLHPEDFAVIVAKGVNAPLAAYGPVCPSVVQVDTPGVTGADMTRFTYRHRRRPLFPFETDGF